MICYMYLACLCDCDPLPTLAKGCANYKTGNAMDMA